jgi:hypothetical protein
MTIIIPYIHKGSIGEVLLFVDDIKFIDCSNNETTIFYGEDDEIVTPLTLEQIQNRIEASNIKSFRLN